LDTPEPRDPYRYARRITSPVDVGGAAWGGEGPPQVEVALGLLSTLEAAVHDARRLAGSAVPEEARPDLVEWDVAGADGLGLAAQLRDAVAAEGLTVRCSVRLDAAAVSPQQTAQLIGKIHRLTVRCTSSTNGEAWNSALAGSPVLWEIAVDSVQDLPTAVDAAAACAGVAGALLSLRVGPEVPLVGAYRLLAARLAAAGEAGGSNAPLVLLYVSSARSGDPCLGSAAHLGSLLCDGLGDALRIEGPEPARAAQLAFTLLQGTRLRLSRTEFISCPSCGRTLFDLESTTQRIKEKTGHLKGVKIAIMGCIVNGPGEMADADFGYVGGAPGKVNLFVGQEMVLRHVPSEQADEQLIALIKEHGKWVEPPTVARPVSTSASGEG